MKKAYQATCFCGEVAIETREVVGETRSLYVMPNGRRFSKRVGDDSFGPWRDSEEEAIRELLHQIESDIDGKLELIAKARDKRTLVVAALHKARRRSGKESA